MMKRCTLLLILALFIQFLPAQLKVVGTHYDAGTGLTSVLRWNADDGALSDSIATTVHVVASGTSLMDAYHDRYYFADPTTLHEVNFDSSSCTALQGIEYGVNAEVSMATGKVFRLKQHNLYDANGKFVTRLWDVVQSRFSTGQDSLLGTITGCSTVYGDVSTFNSNLGIYYFLGTDSLLGLCLYSVRTNAASFTTTKVAIKAPGLSFAGIEYDNEFDIMYALNSVGRGIESHWQIQQVNLSTGALTLEADFPQFHQFQATTCSFDQVASALIFTMIDSTSKPHLFAYATISNSLIPKAIPNGMTINELECDNAVFALLRYGAVGAENQLPKAEVSLYPDPAHDVLYVKGIESLKEISVIDGMGQSTSAVIIANGSAIDVSHLAPGIYRLRARDKAGHWSQNRFVKR